MGMSSNGKKPPQKDMKRMITVVPWSTQSVGGRFECFETENDVQDGKQYAGTTCRDHKLDVLYPLKTDVSPQPCCQ